MNAIATKIDVRNSKKARGRKTRLYFFHKDESVLEGFGNRAARPTTVYRKFLGEVNAKMGLPADAKWAWSRKAGCGCGCSPGFISELSYGKEVFVDLAGAPKTSGKPEEEAEAARRLGIILSDPTMPFNAPKKSVEVAALMN